jgi:hypothetical protein
VTTGERYRSPTSLTALFKSSAPSGVGGTISIQGSLDGTNWVILTDPQGNAITKTAAAIESISEATPYIRPIVTAGDGTTSLSVLLFGTQGSYDNG